MNASNNPVSVSSGIGWKTSSHNPRPNSSQSSKKKIVSIKGQTVSVKSKVSKPNLESISELEVDSQRTFSIDALPAVPSRLQHHKSSSESGECTLYKVPSKDVPSLGSTDRLTLDDLMSGKYADFLDNGVQTRLTKSKSKSPTSLNDLVKRPSYLDNGSLQSINENPELREENQEEGSPLRLTVNIYKDLEETKTNKNPKSGAKSAKNAKSGGLVPDRIINVDDDNDADLDNLEISRDNDGNNAIDLEANIAQIDSDRERQGNNQEQGNDPEAQNAQNVQSGQQGGEQNSNNAAENQSNNEGQATNTGAITQFVWITGPVPAEFLRYAKPETKIYLNKVIGIFFTIILSSVLILFGLYEYLFAIASALTGYLIIIDVTSKASALENLFMKSDDIFQTFDVFAFAFSLVLIYIRLTGILPVSTFAALPFVVLMLLFIANSKASRKIKAWETLKRCYYIAQITLISLKVDKNIDWDWKVVLCLTWVFLAGAFINCLYHVRDLYNKITKPVYPQIPMSKKSKVAGCVWHLFYYALIIPAILGTIGATNIIGPNKDATLIKIAAVLTLIFAVSALLCGFINRQRLIRFIIIGGFIDSRLARYKASKPKKLVKQIDLEVEEKEAYFVMLSTTYFQPLQKSFLTKGKESLEKIKKMLGELKFGKWKLVNSTSTPEKKESIDIESLKQAKEDFDRTLSRPPTFRVAPSITIPKRKFLQINNKNGVVHTAGLTKNSIEHGIDQLTVKYTLSSQNLNDINKFYPIEEASPKIGDDEKLCHLCYVNEPNAVLMNCGHGGICHDCAVTIVKKKDECLECRGKVEAIYKIDPNPKLSNIVKATEISKVVIRMV